MVRNVDVQICFKVMWTESAVTLVNSCLRFEKQSTRDSRQRSADKIISCLKADKSRKKQTKQYYYMHVNIAVCHTQDSVCKSCKLHLTLFSKWDVQCIAVGVYWLLEQFSKDCGK